MAKLLLILLLLTSGSVPPTQAALGESTVPGEYLVRARESRHGRLAAARPIDPSWVLVVDDRAGTPETVARQLSEELGMVVVPNRLVPLAQTDEPRFDEQWALANTGQTGGVPGADIDAPRAWEQTIGDSGVTVAVIDSGVDLDHPDLLTQLWSNPAETAGNGIDDDGNGLVDDVQGWDFVDQDADPDDTVGHGTAVGGVIGAAANGTGVAGAAPGVRIMVLKACNSTCPMSALVASVDYALTHAAQVLNLSLGGFGSGFEPLEDALLRAEQAGVVVVAAAGNTGSDNDTAPYLPAGFEFDNLIAVSASTDEDLLAEFSNFGSASVDLSAPGEDVLAPAIDDWSPVSGTSFSAPHVAGAVGLMLSVDPQRSATEIKSILLDSVDQIPALAGTSISGGRLDAGEAVWQAGAPTSSIRVTSESPTAPSFVLLDGTDSYDPTGSSLQYSWTLDGAPAGTGESITISIEDHFAHEAELVVTDADGLTDRSAVSVDLNGSPTALIEPSSVLAVSPATVVFNVTTSDPDGDPLHVQWLLDDDLVGDEWALDLEVASVGTHDLEVLVNDGIATSTAYAAVLVGEDFVDTGDSIFRFDVAWASATALTSGCGLSRFCPERTITRGEAAAFLGRFFRLPAGPDAFSDDQGNLFEDDINSLALAGISTGCGVAAFCPSRTITRAEWAALLARGLDLDRTSPGRFVDLGGSIFANEIEALAAAGVTLGCNPPANDRFCPRSLVSRAEAVAMLHRADRSLEELGRVDFQKTRSAFGQPSAVRRRVGRIQSFMQPEGVSHATRHDNRKTIVASLWAHSNGHGTGHRPSGGVRRRQLRRRTRYQHLPR